MKKMNETSWRTLMLMTTLFVVFVIFQGTVRTPKLPVAKAKARPPVAVHASKVPNHRKNPTSLRTNPPASSLNLSLRLPKLARCGSMIIWGI
jgi:hypothetical protein